MRDEEVLIAIERCTSLPKKKRNELIRIERQRLENRCSIERKKISFLQPVHFFRVSSIIHVTRSVDWLPCETQENVLRKSNFVKEIADLSPSLVIIINRDTWSFISDVHKNLKYFNSSFVTKIYFYLKRALITPHFLNFDIIYERSSKVVRKKKNLSFFDILNVRNWFWMFQFWKKKWKHEKI